MRWSMLCHWIVQRNAHLHTLLRPHYLVCEHMLKMMHVRCATRPSRGPCEQHLISCLDLSPSTRSQARFALRTLSSTRDALCHLSPIALFASPFAASCWPCMTACTKSFSQM